MARPVVVRANGWAHVAGVAMGERLVRLQSGRTARDVRPPPARRRAGLFRNARAGEHAPPATIAPERRSGFVVGIEPTIAKTTEINR